MKSPLLVHLSNIPNQNKPITWGFGWFPFFCSINCNLSLDHVCLVSIQKLSFVPLGKSNFPLPLVTFPFSLILYLLALSLSPCLLSLLGKHISFALRTWSWGVLGWYQAFSLPLSIRYSLESTWNQVISQLRVSQSRLTCGHGLGVVVSWLLIDAGRPTHYGWNYSAGTWLWAYKRAR